MSTQDDTAIERARQSGDTLRSWDHCWPGNINLDEAPPTTRREMLEKARGELSCVVPHGLPGIKDRLDREHIERAYGLICAALRGGQ